MSPDSRDFNFVVFIRFHIDVLSEHRCDKAIWYKLSSESLPGVFAHY